MAPSTRAAIARPMTRSRKRELEGETQQGGEQAQKRVCRAQSPQKAERQTVNHSQLVLVAHQVEQYAQGTMDTTQILGGATSNEESEHLSTALIHEFADLWVCPRLEAASQATPRACKLQSATHALYSLQESFNPNSHHPKQTPSILQDTLPAHMYRILHLVLCCHVQANVANLTNNGELPLDQSVLEVVESCMLWVLQNPKYWSMEGSTTTTTTTTTSTSTTSSNSEHAAQTTGQFGPLSVACTTLSMVLRSKKSYKLCLAIVENQLKPLLIRFSANPSDLSLLSSLLCLSQMFPLVLASAFLDKPTTMLVGFLKLDSILPTHRQAALLATKIFAALAACKLFNSSPFVGCFCDAALRFEATVRAYRQLSNTLDQEDPFSLVQPLSLILCAHRAVAVQWTMRLPQLLRQAEALELVRTPSGQVQNRTHALPQRPTQPEPQPQAQPQAQPQPQLQPQNRPQPQLQNRPQPQLQPQNQPRPQPNNTKKPSLASFHEQVVAVRNQILAIIAPEVTTEIARRASLSLTTPVVDWKTMPCDLELIVGSENVRLQTVRALLCMASPYVRATLSGTFANVSELQLPHLEVEGVRALLDFLVSPTPTVHVLPPTPQTQAPPPWATPLTGVPLTVEQATSALFVADFLGVEKFFDAVESALCQAIVVDNMDALCEVAEHFTSNGPKGWKLMHFTTLFAMQHAHEAQDSAALRCGIAALGRTFLNKLDF